MRTLERPPERLSRPAKPAGTRRGLVGLSQRERVGLTIHRELDRRLSPLGVWVMQRTKGAITRRFKVDALVLTTVGRRSGRSRKVVLQYFPDGDALIVAAANDGGPRPPAWYLNLTASPAARVEVMGREIGVRAEGLPAAEAAAWWDRIVARAPAYERYARATRRAIPIVRLTPVARSH